MAKKKTVKKSKPKARVKNPISKISSFKEGLKYPWGEPKKLWNILWVLIPIIGWFALLGYGQSILRAIVAGNKKNLPMFVGFGDNLKRGFMLFIKLIPLMVVYQLVSWIPGLGWLIGLVGSIFFMPYLTMNLMVTDKFEESFNFRKTWDAVSNNIEEYMVALVKTVGYVVIYFLLIIVLVGIPCIQFGQCFFLAEFYANHS